MKLVKHYAGISVGDWVSFMRDSRIMIGRVEYIANYTGGNHKIYTSHGDVVAKDVLEVRKSCSGGEV